MRTTDVGAREGTKRGLSVPACRDRAPDVWGAAGLREDVATGRRAAATSTLARGRALPTAERSRGASNGRRSSTVPTTGAEA